MKCRVSDQEDDIAYFEKLNRKLTGTSSPLEYMPESLKEVPSWAKSHYGNKLVLTSRSDGYLTANIKRGLYWNVELVCRAIHALATSYRNGKIDPALYNVYVKEIESLGLKNSISASEQTKSTYKDEYKRSIYFDGYGEIKVVLKEHLKKGVGTNRTEYLRIYYAWVDEVQQVAVEIVAHKPTGED